MRASEPVPGARVVLVRHGATRWSRQRRFTGHTDVPLDPQGIHQAGELAAGLAPLAPDLVLSSDLSRALSTAERIGRATGAPLVADARLREESLGAWEGLTHEEVADRFPDEFARWRAGHLVRGRNREGLAAVVRRAAAALAETLPRTRCCVVVTHVNVVIGITQWLQGASSHDRATVPGPEPGAARLFVRDAHGVWNRRDPIA